MHPVVGVQWGSRLIRVMRLNEDMNILIPQPFSHLLSIHNKLEEILCTSVNPCTHRKALKQMSALIKAYCKSDLCVLLIVRPNSTIASPEFFVYKLGHYSEKLSNDIDFLNSVPMGYIRKTPVPFKVTSDHIYNTLHLIDL